MATPAEPILPPTTSMGAVGLIVADLNRSLAYYTGSLGLHVHNRTPSQAWLGVRGPTLLVLSEQAGARPVQRGHTGLYHLRCCCPRVELAHAAPPYRHAHALGRHVGPWRERGTLSQRPRRPRH